MKPQHIYCEVFMRDVYVFHQWTQEAFESYMLKNYKITFNKLSNLGGCMRVIENGQHDIILLWTRKTKDKIRATATLTHEAIHVTNEILNGAGVEIDTKNDELQAYHISMIVRKTLRGAQCSK